MEGRDGSPTANTLGHSLVHVEQGVAHASGKELSGAILAFIEKDSSLCARHQVAYNTPYICSDAAGEVAAAYATMWSASSSALGMRTADMSVGTADPQHARLLASRRGVQTLRAAEHAHPYRPASLHVGAGGSRCSPHYARKVVTRRACTMTGPGRSRTQVPDTEGPRLKR